MTKSLSAPSKLAPSPDQRRMDWGLLGVAILVFLPAASYLGWRGDDVLVFLVGTVSSSVSLVLSVVLFLMHWRNRSGSSSSGVRWPLRLLALSVVLALTVPVNRSCKAAGVAESQRRGESLAIRLGAYYSAHGEYPKTLEELTSDGLPIRPPPTDPEGWHYKSFASSYVLEFSPGFGGIYSRSSAGEWRRR